MRAAAHHARDCRLGMHFLREIRWRPEIGDPSFMGWFTVFAYLAVAVLAARAWQLKKERIWLAVALGMLALCVNKQFDLQSLFTDIGRVIAWHQGWIENRRAVQKWFVLGIVAGAGLLGSWVVWRFNGFWRRHLLLAAGLLFLSTFIVVRAISFHHFDSILKLSFLGMKVNWILELGGIFLIGLAAVREPLARK
jgi:hypothetical protein